MGDKVVNQDSGRSCLLWHPRYLIERVPDLDSDWIGAWTTQLTDSCLHLRSIPSSPPA